MQIGVAPVQGAAALNFVIQPLWDSVQIGLTASAPLALFTTQIGQGSPVKTLVDTNMTQGGGLPSPNMFRLRGFLFMLLPRSPSNAVYAITDLTDHSRLCDQAIFQFFVGTSGSTLVQGHAMLFPAGLGQEGMVTTGGATSANLAYIIGNGVRRLDNRFGLANFEERLSATEGFRGQIAFPAAPVTSSNSITARIYLAGIFGQSVR